MSFVYVGYFLFTVTTGVNFRAFAISYLHNDLPDVLQNTTPYTYTPMIPKYYAPLILK